ncbi:MAG: hypothetical protein GX575_01240 [Candidatus Anammoximicrobium sp.]|nr:hypothetical protein [Candidatus Anammoximicrobium sp.]
MTTQAQITSIDAVRHFKLALEEFQAETREAITQLLLEMRRGADWIEHDRSRYWPRAMQQASDAVIEARNNLERAELALRPEDKRSCHEYKIALDKAKRRLRLTEDKVRAVRRWRIEVQRAADHFHGGLAKLANSLDMDLPRALAALERMAAALDRYAERSAPMETAGGVETVSASPAAPPPTGDGELPGGAR